MNKTILITGARGGIGQGLSKVFSASGYDVIGMDIMGNEHLTHCTKSISVDLNKLCLDKTYRQNVFAQLNELCQGLHVLINNAAVQLLGAVENITSTDWNTTMNVNLTAPMLLSQWAIPLLEQNNGSIVNIASIHAALTKPEFVAYATSKSALIGMTKAMAVDLNGKVRVNAISPAAIETDMLRAGFNNDQSAIDELRKVHPIQKIGSPNEVAELALFLVSEKAGFINGANYTLDGGISSVLKDI